MFKHINKDWASFIYTTQRLKCRYYFRFCTFRSTVAERNIAEPRDLHIWTQLIVRMLSVCIFTHKKHFFLKHLFFILHFRYINFDFLKCFLLKITALYTRIKNRRDPIKKKKIKKFTVTLFYKKRFYKQRYAEIGRFFLAKFKQHP